MTGKTVRALHLEGNRLFEEGRFGDAARAFDAALDRFLADRTATKAAVDEFVKVAGNLCVCHHAAGDWHRCVTTARELLATYPIIPKAYAAIGMCIVSRLLEQEAEQQATDAQNSPSMPPRSGEEVRRDARRYFVKLGGVVCTADDAHAYLCRAILFSDGELQVSLGPYVETVVRWISEQLLSAGLSLEREYGEGVLGELSAMEERVCDAPLLLDTAPVPMTRQSIRVLDAAEMSGGGAGRRVEELPEEEAGAVINAVREGQRAAAQGHAERDELSAATDAPLDNIGGATLDGQTAAAAAAPPSSSQPLDFLLSRQRTQVRVCHAERGGIPRGLTLVRAAGPFAVGQHVQPAPPADATSPAGGSSALALPAGGQCATALTAPSHVDPFDNTTAAGGSEAAEYAMAVAALSASRAHGDGSGGASMCSLGAAESPPLVTCNACGREVNPLQLSSSAQLTSCAVCHGVAYCSAACEEAYRERHSLHECAMRVVLQRRTEALVATGEAAAAATATAPAVGHVDPLPAGEVLPGGGWSALDLHRRVLPLCITVFSGLRCNARGAVEVRTQVRRGVQPRLRHALPAEVALTLAEWRACVDPAPPITAEDATVQEEEEENGVQGANENKPRRAARRRRTTAEAPADAAAATPAPEDELLVIFFVVRLLAVDHADSRCSAFYAERLLLRHSCEPNCVWSDTLHGIVTARFICKGEELTMALDDGFPQHWPWQVRQKWAVHYHGVPCQCARCAREGADLHHSRGSLSNELIEQLLTADIMGHPCPTPAHAHPTHLFHRKVQLLVERSRAPLLRHVPELLNRIDEMRAELVKYVLPSHYLLEDLRRATLNIAEAEDQLPSCTGEAQSSLLFWESLWAGAIPAKRRQLRLLPSVFECGRRRKPHPHQQRRRRRATGPPTLPPAVASGSPDASPERRRSSPTPSPTPATEGGCGSGRSPGAASLRGSMTADGDDEASKARGASAAAASQRTPRTPAPTPLVATKDFASGRNIIDLFHGSYQTWYM